jgi:hypothetical protein
LAANIGVKLWCIIELSLPIKLLFSRMKSFLATLTLAVSAAVVDAKLIVMPPVTTTGTDVAIVWIHGMDCDNAAYQTLAAEV